MSSYHIKEIVAGERKANVVFHIPVPAINNNAGIPLRTAISQALGGASFTSQVPWITPSELIQIQNGEIFEHSELVTFLAKDTKTRKLTKIDLMYAKLAVSELNRLRRTYRFWGMDKVII